MSGSSKNSIHFTDPFSASKETARERRDSAIDNIPSAASFQQDRRPAITPRSASVMASGVLDSARLRAGRTPPPPPPPSAAGKKKQAFSLQLICFSLP